MKNIFYFTVFVGLFFLSCNTTEKPPASLTETGSIAVASVSAPFSKGVNFSNWFQEKNAQKIPFNQYSEQDFINVKSLGADVIRLPISFNDMTSGAPDYTIAPLLFRLLDIAVGWAEKYGIYLILDNHPHFPNGVPDNIDRILIPVWEQVARRYANRSDYIVYEILNEPYGISDERWGEIQGRAVDAIRRYDQKHWIIVTKAEWSGIDKFYAIPEYRDSKLIYTFHFYDPFLFTHQGASWTEPSEMGLFSNILFPYDRARMPALPSSLRGQWIEGWYRDYRDAASPQKILETLDAVTAFSRQRNVPVFCGEYGVLMSASPSADRAVWYEFVTNALDVRNISRTSWDYFGGFGMFNPTGRDFYADVNVDIARAMGFTPPAQSPQSAAVIRAGYVLYDDFINPELSAYSWGDPDVEWILFESNAADGEFAIRWANAGRYQAFLFNFPRKANLTEIAANGYLEFKARTDRPVRFDVRFLNPDNASSLPWRMNYTVNESILPPDGRWHTIRIKLSEMRDVGAWSNSTQTWHNPVGAFRWDNIESLDFTAEYMDLKGCSIYFDSIKITH